MLTVFVYKGRNDPVSSYLDIRFWTLASVEDQKNPRHIPLEVANRASNCVRPSGFANVARGNERFFVGTSNGKVPKRLLV